VLRQLANGADSTSEVHALALQADGKIVAAGFAGPEIVVARLMGDSTSAGGPGGSPPGAGGGNPLGPSTAVATLSKLGITPTVFAAADSGPTISRTVGAQVSYEDSQAITTMFTVFKRSRGVRHKGLCLKPKRHRTGKRCTRWVVAGRFTHADHVGLNTFHFSGRIHGRKLRPGRYRLRARPRFQGPTAKAIETRFRIVS
jgi:hypothetical protein